MATPQSPSELTAADMMSARLATPFDPQALNRLLNAGSRDAGLRRKVIEIAKKEPLLQKRDRPFLSRKERLYRGVQITKRILELVDEHGLDYNGYMELLGVSECTLGINLHQIAFEPVLQSQGTDEQQVEWVPKAKYHAIIGCYAQTEMAHGSNLQKLETTATYVPETEEFEIHSPTLTSTKWWMGGLGLISTHCVVQARLILYGKNYGPHLFICPLRDMKTHRPLPGREIGEIGPKVLGSAPAVDNGFVRFDHVRVPRANMLARFAQVTKDGRYQKPPHSKLSYGGMLFIRARMIGDCGWQLAKAATISGRYCTVRRQFDDPEEADRPGEGAASVEKQVIYYPSVYMRLVPIVAKAWAYITIGKDMAALFASTSSQLAKGDTTLLAETHAVSSGLKVYATTQTVEGCETARRAMGGHGFLEAGGVGRIYANWLPSVTYEGDNYILSLQVCRAALKTLRAIRSNPSTAEALSPSSAYLSVCTQVPFLPPLTSTSDWLAPSTQASLVDLRAAHHVQRLESLTKSGRRWSELSWECQAANTAIVESFVVRRLLAAVDGGLLSEGIGSREQKAVKDLVTFHNLHTLSQASGDLFEFGLLASSSASTTQVQPPIEVLRATVDALARSLVPQIIGLTDAFGFDDWDLDSSLGRYDGKVYEDLLERARETASLNAGDEREREELYRTSIRPILERGARLAKL